VVRFWRECRREEEDLCLVVNGHKTLEGFFIFSLRVVVARYSQLIKRLPSADKSVETFAQKNCVVSLDLLLLLDRLRP
jgi:hypothetical protein